MSSRNRLADSFNSVWQGSSYLRVISAALFLGSALISLTISNMADLDHSITASDSTPITSAMADAWAQHHLARRIVARRDGCVIGERRFEYRVREGKKRGAGAHLTERLHSHPSLPVCGNGLGRREQARA
jgi:hypothetical protein